MNGAEGLTGSCKDCGTTLNRALVREVRHFEDTRLLEVTCGGCERRFLAIQIEAVPIVALNVVDVAEAAEQLELARSLSELFAPSDLDLPDAA
jgi:RNase P subunit RPR2